METGKCQGSFVTGLSQEGETFIAWSQTLMMNQDARRAPTEDSTTNLQSGATSVLPRSKDALCATTTETLASLVRKASHSITEIASNLPA